MTSAMHADYGEMDLCGVKLAGHASPMFRKSKLFFRHASFDDCIAQTQWELLVWFGLWVDVLSRIQHKSDIVCRYVLAQ